MKNAPDQATIESAPSKHDFITADSLQKGSIDGALAGLLALAATCAVLLAGGLPV